MKICKKCIVSGRVQGVWYRASTQQQAQAMGVTGQANNLHNGSVEVIACGEEENVEQLIRWLWQGPSHADVSNVQCEGININPPYSFTTG